MAVSRYHKNPISAFHEYGMKCGQDPSVEVATTDGPAHKLTYTAEARLGDRVVCEETASSKHESRIKCAEKALCILNTEDAEQRADDLESDAWDEHFCPVPEKHPVSALMEYAQALKMPCPDFNLISQQGPRHVPVFIVEVTMGDCVYRRVTARTMREARGRASCVILNQLRAEGKLTRVYPVLVDQAKAAQPGSVNGPVKSPVMVLNEFAQKNCLNLRFEPIAKSGPLHKPVFDLRVILGDVPYEIVRAGSLKEARLIASQKMLELLAQQKIKIEPPAATNGTNEMYNRRQPQTLYDRIGAAALMKLDKLLLECPLGGRKIVAAIVMTTRDNDEITVISVGAGNRCLKGDQLSDDGKKLHDSHAEVLARRGFKRYLYKLLQEQPRNLITRGSSGKWIFRTGVEFHLYVSTAPCGDGALFAHSERSEYHLKDAPGANHEPIFTNNRTQGLLRAKQENGEGTIPIEPEFIGQTFDGIHQGERLRVMSCSDKICSWNVLGLQGALLSTVFEPVYLKSILLGSLYHQGHLSRALCCRVDKGVSPIARMLPPGYRVNHPDLALVNMQDNSRAVERSKALCMNWCHGDEQPEVTHGTLGMVNRTSKIKVFHSQLCKLSLFEQYKSHVWRSDQTGVTYAIRKHCADEYNRAKLVFKKQLEKRGFGTWVELPKEVDRFC